ncbi:MAG TPA: zinc-binding dehydrogenase [Chloroflexota bacterium]|nr:zinc-binding dehydrogenase [Chloroflexota bacterium]
MIDRLTPHPGPSGSATAVAAPSGTMPAARYYGPAEGLAVEPVPVPTAGPHDAVVRVLAAGVCHTELQLLAGTLNLGVSPLTLGHEIAGEVVAVGEAVRAVQPGDRVVVYYYAPCGACRWCRTGAEQLCPDAAPQVGFTADGGFAPYVRVPAASLVPLPASVPVDEAATIGCSVATALHAVRAVADLRLGETAVVYGVGAVGFALVQLARLAGARVLAIGRTPAKLALARELGADATVNAAEADPVDAVLRWTAGEGADAVFECVAAAETMAAAVRMLRRRGRLVFVGYGAAPFAVNPLLLVLREARVLGAVGNTRAELVEAVDLVARGQVRPVVSRRYPLSEVNTALAALRAGEIVGRAVLEPNGPLPTPERAPAAPAVIAPPAPPPELQPEIEAFIARGVDASRDEAAFNELALRLFAYQFRHNAPYRRFCERRGRTPDTVSRWQEVPAVPIAAFKETVLTTFPPERAAACFQSSGTTGSKPSRHYHENLVLYDLSATLNWQAHLLPEGRPMRLLVLSPPRQAMPHSSLAHYLSLMVERYGTPDSAFLLHEKGIDLEALTAALRASEASGQPVALLATSFAFVHLLDALAERGLRFQLPPGSRLMDTGGYKGRSREVPRRELYAQLRDALGIPREYCVNMYGLTEHSTQFLDAVLRNHLAGVAAPRYKTVVPWARTRVLDPETLEELPPGEIGLLCHFDLANRSSVAHVLTEDIGYLLGDGFELVGRASGTEARGCSIAIDELLSAQHEANGER